MRKLLVAALVIVFTSLLAAQAPAARTVRVGDDYFDRRGNPPTITVSRGTKVTWRWVGRNFHDVRVRRGPVKFHSALKDSGRYSRTMRTRGTYKIICRIHQPDMAMTLRVR